MYNSEKLIAEKLVLIDRRCINADISDIHRYIQREERENRMMYADLQRKAIVDAMSNGVMVLTGGPGTGKTTVVKALLKIFLGMGMKVALCAPTGRAAKRLSESTASEAKTVHRMLEMTYEGDTFTFARNEKNYLDENVIIVDEVSMVDTLLMAALLKAVKPGARLILIGDADQLPSVGAGNVLRDIIESRRFATVKLTEIFRQAEKSLIVTNAHRINLGEKPVLDKTDNDFFFLARESDSAIAATVVDLYKNRLPKAYGAETAEQIQVISPSRRGMGGTDRLNLNLQSALNPARNGKAEFAHRERVFRVGDRVMQIRNNYELEWTRGDKNGMGIFNGDIGDIIAIDVKNRYMEISFDERIVRYEFALLEDIEHAYAITVHKSQGSEFDCVIIPLLDVPPLLKYRNLLYTAVTRAKKLLVIIGSEEIFSQMVKNNKKTLRYTLLKNSLCEAADEAY
jgi:exodeoxyribonuclease V alpha subunit